MHINNQFKPQESGIRKYKAIATNNPALIDFTLGDTCLNTDDTIKNAVITSIINNETHYSSTQGSLLLREAIASKENHDPNNILITIGASEGLYLAMKLILNINDEVIIFKPCYGLYPNIVKMNGGIPKYVSALEHIDIEGLKNSINERTSAVILNIPNNPTGLIYCEEELKQLVSIIKEYDLWLILDATYDGLIYTDKHINYFDDIKNNIIIVKSFSKLYSMSGFRMGYVLANTSIMSHLVNIHQNIISCPITFLQKAGIAALDIDTSSILNEYKKRYNYVLDCLAQTKFKYIIPDGGFYICLCCEDSIAFNNDLINNAKVIGVPGVCFGDNNLVRLSYSTSWDNLIEGMSRLKAYSDNVLIK